MNSGLKISDLKKNKKLKSYKFRPTKTKLKREEKSGPKRVNE